MNARPKILVVEDEEQLLRMLRATLIQAGYNVATASTGLNALEQLAAGAVDLILLDLGLPDIDGKELISRSRTVSSAPVMVISGRAAEREKIAALDLGASDYVAKPFETGELLARIRVALRPLQSRAAAAPPLEGKLLIDLDARRVKIEGRAARLSRKEAEMVRALIEADGAVVSHDALIEQIWGPGTDADAMNLRVLAWQVRRKIEPTATAPCYLISEAGAGYRLKLE